MKMQSVSNFIRTSLLWSCIMVMVLTLFSCIVMPVQAAGDKGWIEARVTVPDDFTESIIVCVINLETYEEFATRLMEVNDYVSVFEVPAGKYQFDGAFLENGDFRYNTDLINDAQTFTVSSDKKAPAALISLKTVFNEEYKDGTALVPPTKETIPEETMATEPEETATSSSGNAKKPSSGTAQKPSTGNNKDAAAETKPSSVEIVPSSKETEPALNTEPTPTVQPAAPQTETTAPAGTTITPGLENMSTQEPSSVRDEKPKKDKAEETVNKAENEDKDEEDELSFGMKFLYTVIATVVFCLIVFILAYFYRRHVVKNQN